MASGQQNQQELEEKARHGETVVPCCTGGKSFEAQKNLAEGRSRGGQTRKEQRRADKEGAAGDRRVLGDGGLSTMDRSGGERAGEGIYIDESKFRNRDKNQNQ